MAVSAQSQWNVVSFMAIVLTLGFVGVAATAMLMEIVTFAEFLGATSSLVGAWGGYMARALGETKQP